jgi:hypothetical protein
MELTNPFVTAETNKTAAVMIKLLEHCLGHGHTMWMDRFYRSLELSWLKKSENTDRIWTSWANRNNVPPVVKNKKLKKGGHCGRWLRRCGINAWQDKKQVSDLRSTHHRAEMFVDCKYSEPRRNHACGCLSLQCRHVTCASERSDATAILAGKKERYQVEFEIIWETTHCSDMWHSGHVPVTPKYQKHTYSLKFMLSLAQGLVKKHSSGVHPVHSCPSLEPPPKRLAEWHFLEHIPATGRKAELHRKCMLCTEQGERREFIYWLRNVWKHYLMQSQGQR